MAKHWIATSWGSPDDWEFVDYEPAAPGSGEITIRVHAAGVNPADAKHVAAPRGGVELPVPIGYEVSGIVSAVGPDTEIGSGAVRVGDEVLAFRIRGGYADEVTIPAEKAFHKPAGLTHPEAANLLLAGTTAAQMLAVTRAAPGETILLHGASGAVGVSVLQQAALRGIRVIGTASEARSGEVRRYGGIPVVYGDGLVDRVRALTDEPIAAALDAVGTDEAVDVSLELVDDRTRIVTIAAAGRARAEGFEWIVGSQPESTRFRDAARAGLIDLAARGLLVVPLARTYPLEQAPEALAFLATGHPGGKIALVP
ncbi:MULTISPECIES: NADP-dependent oxidoreductase [unclassified Microbacterium]|uniref:NADP-dependent oxidoreductase n=1 Tax=unclassified Microbacterium TaxID=2609290 RepID=UPI001D2C0AA8|nr:MULTISPECIES: NADP-dependent oxidoreductase [unclassified Microbacterium]CAH0163076.1 2-haloacrylate reductase [Microbacterium sp. Bi121]HWK78738.1 NADP-dependent oxidoreductase [Microbacterium sp.]